MLLNVLSGIQHQTASYSFDLKNTCPPAQNIPVACAVPLIPSAVSFKQFAQCNQAVHIQNKSDSIQSAEVWCK